MLKALSLTQPWASLVALGIKQVETRSWATQHRGWIAIHASKGFPKWAVETCFEDEFCAPLKAAGFEKPGGLPTGAIIGVVRIIGYLPTSRITIGETTDYSAGTISKLEELYGDYGENRYGLFLADAVALPEPIPCKGALSLWQVPPDIEARILDVTGIHVPQQ